MIHSIVTLNSTIELKRLELELKEMQLKRIQMSIDGATDVSLKLLDIEVTKKQTEIIKLETKIARKKTMFLFPSMLLYITLIIGGLSLAVGEF